MAKGRNSIIISGILAAFVAGLIITVSSADAGGAPPPPSGPDAGDFACYSEPIPTKPFFFMLDDQFGTTDHKIDKFLGFCASATKTIPDGTVFESPFGFGHHMMRWNITATSPDVRVELTDQFGTFEHNVLEAREIITPAFKKSGGTTFPPMLDVHWKCYGIDGEPISGPVTLDDQFPVTLSTKILTPDLLCAPATKTLLDGTSFSPQEGFEDTHLKCYNIDKTTVPINSLFSDQFFGAVSVGVGVAESEKLCTTVKKTVLPKPCVNFTVKGQDIPGSEQCNLEATDVWVKFRGPATMQFTQDGSDIPPLMPKPKGTNDFHVEWDPATCEFLDPPGVIWTKNGVPVGLPTSIPLGANDFDFDAKKIAQVMWSFPDDSMVDVPIPKGHVTDVHFECEFPG